MAEKVVVVGLLPKEKTGVAAAAVFPKVKGGGFAAALFSVSDCDEGLTSPKENETGLLSILFPNVKGVSLVPAVPPKLNAVLLVVVSIVDAGLFPKEKDETSGFAMLLAVDVVSATVFAISVLPKTEGFSFVRINSGIR